MDILYFKSRLLGRAFREGEGGGEGGGGEGGGGYSSARDSAEANSEADNAAAAAAAVAAPAPVAPPAPVAAPSGPIGSEGGTYNAPDSGVNVGPAGLASTSKPGESAMASAAANTSYAGGTPPADKSSNSMWTPALNVLSMFVPALRPVMGLYNGISSAYNTLNNGGSIGDVATGFAQNYAVNALGGAAMKDIGKALGPDAMGMYRNASALSNLSGQVGGPTMGSMARDALAGTPQGGTDPRSEFSGSHGNGGPTQVASAPPAARPALPHISQAAAKARPALPKLPARPQQGQQPQMQMAQANRPALPRLPARGVTPSTGTMPMGMASQSPQTNPYQMAMGAMGGA